MCILPFRALRPYGRGPPTHESLTSSKLERLNSACSLGFFVLPEETWVLQAPAHLTAFRMLEMDEDEAPIVDEDEVVYRSVPVFEPDDDEQPRLISFGLAHPEPSKCTLGGSQSWLLPEPDQTQLTSAVGLPETPAARRRDSCGDSWGDSPGGSCGGSCSGSCGDVGCDEGAGDEDDLDELLRTWTKLRMENAELDERGREVALPQPCDHHLMANATPHTLSRCGPPLPHPCRWPNRSSSSRR